MFDQWDIQDDIESTVHWYLANMPETIKTLLGHAKQDLANGPVYLDSDGDGCSCFDDGATPFQFDAACQSIASHLESVSDIEMETYYNEETDESQFESVSGSRESIIRGVVGADLFPYL